MRQSQLNDMIDEIDSINQILPDRSPGHYSGKRERDVGERPGRCAVGLSWFFTKSITTKQSNAAY